MNQIPPQDKETVVNRLAQGESYSQAMADTAIKSKDTVHRIAQQETNAIERKRLQYLKKIKKYGASDNRRAEMWAKMVYANKVVGKDAVERPDWQARASALKYIDNLAGLSKEAEMKLEVNDITPVQPIDINSPEAIDFNKKFHKFIMQET